MVRGRAALQGRVFGLHDEAFRPSGHSPQGLKRSSFFALAPA
jgi:hypothetical protein